MVLADLGQKVLSADRVPSDVHSTADERPQLAHFADVTTVRVGGVDECRDLVELFAMT